MLSQCVNLKCKIDQVLHLHISFFCVTCLKKKNIGFANSIGYAG